MSKDEEIDADDSIDHGTEILKINWGEALEFKLHTCWNINLLKFSFGREYTIAHI